MKMKTILAALALAIAPTLAIAEGCSSRHSEQAMSCGEGTVWDADTQSCVEQVTG